MRMEMGLDFSHRKRWQTVELIHSRSPPQIPNTSGFEFKVIYEMTPHAEI